MAADNGIILRLPAMEDVPPGADLFLFDPEELEGIVTDSVADSALFGSRFRENAARALLLPRRNPGKRTPLWQQRQRAAQLLDVARKYPEFPILLETARECLQDVYDLPALLQVHRALQSRGIALMEVETEAPSPFARTLLFEYVAEHLYDADAPAAERRAAALALDPAMLAELLGTTGLRELLDPAVLTQTLARLQRTGERYRASGVEGAADLLRQLGPLSARELAERLRPESADPELVPPDRSEEHRAAEPPASEEYARKLAEQLVHARRAYTFEGPGTPESGPQLYYAAVEDAARLRDGLGIMPAAALPLAFLEPVAEPLEDLVSRFARTHIPFGVHETAAHFSRLTPVGTGILLPVLLRLQRQRRVTSGEFLPEVLRGASERAGGPSGSPEWVDVQVLRTIRARSLAALRQEIEPVPARAYGFFLPAWQNVRSLSVRVARPLAEASAYGAYIEPQRTARIIDEAPAPLTSAAPENAQEEHTSAPNGAQRLDEPALQEELLTAIDQLAGVRMPASALETLILPARIKGYRPHLLDELMMTGRVFFTGAGRLGGASQRSDGWIRLHLSESAPLTLGPGYPADFLQEEEPELLERLQTPGTLEHAIHEALAHGGLFVPALRERVVQILGEAAAPGQTVSFPDTTEFSSALWRLVWAGVLTNDSFGPVRATLAGVRSAHPTPAAAPRLSRVSRRGAGRIAAARASMGRSLRGGYAGGGGGPSPVAPQDSGRFSRVDSLLGEPLDPTVAALARADLLLDRYGVLTRGCLQGEDSPGGFSQLYRIYSEAEDRALVRRGYFIEGLGAAQFAAPATVDALRSAADRLGSRDEQPHRTATEEVFGTFRVTLLAATDPANPYGAALAWPELPKLAQGSAPLRHRPARKAGACVVFVDGAPVLYLERGAKTLLIFTTDPVLLEAAAPAIARMMDSGGMDKISIEKVNDVELLDGSPALDRNGEDPVQTMRRALQHQGFYTTVRGLSMRRPL